MKRLWKGSGVVVVGLLLVALADLAMAGLIGFGGDSWKEEVLLHDGSKLIITRSQTYGGRHEIGQPPPIKEHTVTFTLPNTNKTITWTSEYGEDLGRTNFHLLAVHVLNGTPFLVTRPNLCPSYNKWGRPNPPYVFFKYDGATWQRIQLEAFPAELTTINVVLGLSRQFVDAMVKQGLVPDEQIQKQNSQLPQPEFKTILRVAVPADGISLTSCPIPSAAGGKLVVPEIDGKPLHYNWWPLATEWLKSTYGKGR